jgi:hypothetical protein
LVKSAEYIYHSGRKYPDGEKFPEISAFRPHGYPPDFLELIEGRDGVDREDPETDLYSYSFIGSEFSPLIACRVF